MFKINFNKKDTNFFKISSFVKKHNLNHTEVLRQAFKQMVLSDSNKDLLMNFINSINTNSIYSQLYQDVFASFVVDKILDKTFFEFGATDGIKLSNTYTLEKIFNWKGAVSEPDPQWQYKLKKNRPKTIIIKDCIWRDSGKELNFFVSDIGELSTLNDFKENDKNSMPENTKKRLNSGRMIKVNTISLNDVIKEKFNSKCPSYISIDTEGSEYEILKDFNFKKFRPALFTVEHNFTALETKIDELMIKNLYVRVFDRITAFDGWYISKEVFDLLIKL